LAERLNEDDMHKIALSYEGGELRRDIAARYKISVSSVGRLLRKWRTERGEVA
jgi:transposase